MLVVGGRKGRLFVGGWRNVCRLLGRVCCRFFVNFWWWEGIFCCDGFDDE